MPVELTETDYYKILGNHEGVAVVQFTAPWCGPCRMLAPRLQELSEERGIDYFKVDVDASPRLAQDFKVMSIPTLLWYKDGELFKTTVGAMQRKALDGIVDTLI